MHCHLALSDRAFVTLERANAQARAVVLSDRRDNDAKWQRQVTTLNRKGFFARFCHLSLLFLNQKKYKKEGKRIGDKESKGSPRLDVATWQCGVGEKSQ